MARKLLIFSGTSFFKQLKEIMTSGEHFFPPDSNEYSIISVDTQSISPGVQLPNEFSFKVANIAEGQRRYKTGNDPIVNYIVSQLEAQDKNELEKYDPRVGGAGATWKGGFLAYLDVMDQINGELNNTIAKTQNQSSDIILTGGALGGTKSGFLISLLFHTAYHLLQDINKTKPIRVHILLSIPDQQLESYPNKIAYKENAIKLLYYTNKFLNLMRKNGRPDVYIHLFLPKYSEDYDTRKIIWFASYLCYEQIPSRLVDESQQGGRNYFTIYSEEFFLPMSGLIETLTYQTVKGLVERHLEELNKIYNDVLKNLNDPDRARDILTKPLNNKIQYIQPNDVSEWFATLNTQVIPYIKTELEGKLREINTRANFSVSDIIFVESILRLSVDFDQHFQQIRGDLERILLQKFRHVQETQFKDHLRVTGEELKKLTEDLKEEAQLIKDKFNKRRDSLGNFKTVIDDAQPIGEIYEILKKPLSNWGKASLPSGIQTNIENSFNSALKNGGFDKAMKDIEGILKSYFFEKQNVEYRIRNIRSWINGIKEEKLKKFSDDLVRHVNLGVVLPPVHQIQTRTPRHLFLFSNYLEQSKLGDTIKEFSRSPSSVSQLLGIAQRTNFEIEAPISIDEVQEIYLSQKENFVFKIGIWGVLPFKELDELSLIKNNYYQI